RFILDDGCPRFDGVFVRLFGFAVHVHQHTAHVWILQADRAVLIPRERNPTLTAARLIRRDVGVEDGIIQRLQFPGDDAVFDVDHPRTTACAVHAVRASYHAVVLPAIAVELFPLTGLRV